MAANSSLTFNTSSSNTAFILDSSGVTIATAKSITAAAKATIDFSAAESISFKSGAISLASVADSDTLAKKSEIEITNDNISAKVWSSLTDSSYLHITKEGISLGSTSGTTFTSSIDLTNNKIAIKSTGTFEVDARNIEIHSSLSAANSIGFEIRRDVSTTATETSIRMTRDYGSYLDGWFVSRAWMWSGINEGTTALIGDKNMFSNTFTLNNGLEGNNSNKDRWELVKKFGFYCGKSWPEDPPSSSTNGWAPVKITKSGGVYANGLCLGTGPADIGTAAKTGNWAG